MPNVTGYLIAGIIIGPCVFGLISHEQLSGAFKVITDVALAFIAFSIGVEFKLSHFKQIGKSVLIITLAQAITTAILVDIVLITLALTTEFVSLPVAICLGAIATATAPAALRFPQWQHEVGFRHVAERYNLPNTIHNYRHLPQSRYVRTDRYWQH